MGTESENVEDKEKDNESAEFKDITNGLGNHIEWVTLEAGLTLAKELDKPLLLIIHKSWCGACRGKYITNLDQEGFCMRQTEHLSP